MTGASSDAITSSPRFTFEEFALSLLGVLIALTPDRIITFFLFAQPLFDFTDNDTLTLIKHIVIRLLVLYLLFQTSLYLSNVGKRMTFTPIGIERGLLIYGGTAVFSVVAAVLRNDMGIAKAFASVTTLLMLFSLCYLIPYWCGDRIRVLKLAKWFLASFTAVTLAAVVQVILSQFLPSVFGFNRLSSLFHDANIFARFLIFGIFFSVPLLLNHSPLVGRKLTIVTIVLALGCILLSLSRSGLFALLAGCIILGALMGKKKIMMIIVVFAIITGTLGLRFINAERLAPKSSVFEMSTFNRIQIVLGGLDIFSQHWLTGIGYTNFQNFYASQYLVGQLDMSLSSYEQRGYTVAIHNWTVEVLSEQGIFGLVGFCMLFYLLFKLVRRARLGTADKTMQALLVGHTLMLFIFLLQGFFYHTFISQFFFWMMIGFALATVKAIEHDGAKEAIS